MNTHELAEALAKHIPASQEAWDNVGELVASRPNTQVAGVLVAVDATPHNLKQAERLNCNFVLTHHPLFLKAPHSFGNGFNADTYKNACLDAAIQSNLTCYAAHTNLDRCSEARLGLAHEVGLVSPTCADIDGYGIDFSTNGLTNAELIKHFAGKLNVSPGVLGSPEARATKAIYMPGSGSSFVSEIVARGYNLMVTGELNYHAALEANFAHLTVITLGHGVSEQGYLPWLANLVTSLDPSIQTKVLYAKPLENAFTKKAYNHD